MYSLTVSAMQYEFSTYAMEAEKGMQFRSILQPASRIPSEL